MKKSKTVLCVVCLFVLLSSLLCGCEIGPNSIESLMRPPHVGSGQELEKAISDLLGNAISLRSPQSGSCHTAVTLRDLNGDGQEEAVVFYSRAASSTRMCVLRQNGGKWQKVNDFAGDGNGIYCVDFDDMNGDGKSEIFVGWYLFNDKSKKTMTVYSCVEANEQLSVKVCTSESYDCYALADVLNNGEKQLLLAYADASKTATTTVLKRIALDDSGRVLTAGSVSMDSRIVRIDSLAYDQPKEGKHPRIFVDAQLSENQMITEVFLWSNERNNFYCPFRDGKSGLNTLTQRGDTLRCADVNNDGLIEIPLRKELKQSKAGEVAMGYVLEWCSMQGEEPVPQLYYAVNIAHDYKLFLPKDWIGKIAVHYTDASHWSFVNNRNEELFSVTVSETSEFDTIKESVTVLDDQSAPGMTYYCNVTKKGEAFGVTEEILKAYFEYASGGNVK
ncbi:MAG TPA: hypothetical protein DDY98_02650 [Ruminococcaceae bacterium]|nr:hypothetical protein [Oscillospiraceae bacterium]